MNKLFAPFAVVVLLTITISVRSQTQEAPAWCGMDRAAAEMPSELQVGTSDSAAGFALQSNELLLFLDFDGALVRRGFPNASGLVSRIIGVSAAFCPAPDMTATEKERVVELVKDDFSPFNIRVTTDQAEFDNYPAANKHICIVTTVPSVVGGSSIEAGIADFANVGVRLASNPCFVFASELANDPDDVASVTSHESGHTLGLGHQHFFTNGCIFQSEYRGTAGTGPTSFGALMGIALGGGITNWFDQPCLSPFFGVPQNDYELIGSQVAVRGDDFPDAPGGDVLEHNEFTGVLERAGDADFVLINFKAPGPVTVSSKNIDLKVSVLTPGERLMQEFNDPEDTNVTIPIGVGMRYLKIEAADNANVSARFMTGKYKVVY